MGRASKGKESEGDGESAPRRRWRARIGVDDLQRSESGPNSTNSDKDQEHRRDVCGTKKAAEVAVRFAGGCYCLFVGCWLVYTPKYTGTWYERILSLTLIGLGLASFLFPAYYNRDCYDEYPNSPPPTAIVSSGLHHAEQWLMSIPPPDYLDMCECVNNFSPPFVNGVPVLEEQ